MPASGEATSMPSASGASLMPACDRVVALGALEVEDEDEHQREAREPVDERGGGGGGEEPVAEDGRGRASARACAVSIRTKSGSSTAAATRPPMTSGLVPAREAALARCRDEPGEADDERGGAEEVEAARLVGLGQLVQDERSPTARRASPNGTLNQKTHCQEIAHERAAEDRAEDEADRGDHGVGAHGDAELLLRERVGDERGGVGEQECGADALEDPPEDQLGAAARRSPRRARRARTARSRRRRRACGRRGRTAGRR